MQDATDNAENKGSEPSASGGEKSTPRKIGGNIPYVASPGPFKKALDAIIEAEKPDTFDHSFMETIVGVSGGSARAIPPQLKKLGFLSSDGQPTERYSQFRSESGRSSAALAGLKEAFSDIFARNSYAHRKDEAGVKDIIVQITGLKRSDRIVGLMYQTFDAVRSYITDDVPQHLPPAKVEKSVDNTLNDAPSPRGDKSLGLCYNINVVIPETDDPAVLNAIFRAIKDNLLR